MFLELSELGVRRSRSLVVSDSVSSFRHLFELVDSKCCLSRGRRAECEWTGRADEIETRKCEGGGRKERKEEKLQVEEATWQRRFRDARTRKKSITQIGDF